MIVICVKNKQHFANVSNSSVAGTELNNNNNNTG